MKSETSIVAAQCRIREWAEQIRECQNRPEGMKVDRLVQRSWDLKSELLLSSPAGKTCVS